MIGRINLMTRIAFRWMCRTLYTSPIPPTPRRARIWYLPSMGVSRWRRRKSVMGSPQKGQALNFGSISDLQWMQKNAMTMFDRNRRPRTGATWLLLAAQCTAIVCSRHEREDVPGAHFVTGTDSH